MKRPRSKNQESKTPEIDAKLQQKLRANAVFKDASKSLAFQINLVKVPREAKQSSED